MQETQDAPVDAQKVLATILQPKEKTSKNMYIYLMATIANLMAMTAGISIAWISPVLPNLNADSRKNPLGRPVTQAEASWIASLIYFGAMFGPVMAASADKFGRKRVLLIVAFFMAVSFLTTAFANTIFLFYISRFMLGIGTGNVFAILPMFLGEIAENHNRGALTCSMGIFVSSGFNFAYVFGSYFSVRHFCLACACPPLIFIVCFSILGLESPVFLASNNKEKKLRSNLRKLRNKADEEIEIELTDLVTNIGDKKEKKNNNSTFVEVLLKTKSVRKALIISLGLIVFQQFCGIGAIVSYMQIIFDATGIEFSPQICTIIVGTVQMFATLLASVVVDRLGRRSLLLSSAFGMSATIVFLGLYFYLKNHQFRIEMLSWLPVTSLIIFVMAFSLGIGPVPWAIVAEVFPSDIRSNAAALCSFFCFLAAFIVIYLFPLMSESIGMANCFWIFAGICLLLFIFVYALLPETKGKSFDEIQKLLET